MKSSHGDCVYLPRRFQWFTPPKDHQTSPSDLNSNMKLTSLIPIVLISVLAVGASAQQRDKNKGAPRNRPNIIFFISDDQNKEQIGCYGGKVLTPHLDRLAREGMRMDNAHVIATVCTPSRYSMFTGRYPGNSYFKPYLEEFPKNRHGAPGFNVGLEEDNMNVGNVLRLSGYVTGHVGKLHVGAHLKKTEEFTSRGMYDSSAKEGVDPEAPEVIAGWQKNERWYRQWIMDRGFSWAKHVYWGNIQHPYNDHNPDWTLEAALEFIEENHDKPFYLHYTTTMMHGGTRNWNASLDKTLTSGAGRLEKPANVPFSREELCKQVDEAGMEESTYGFTWMDATVGAMLDKLDKLGIADNTLFVFVSDHGTHGKFSLHDHNGTAIPCIIRWPGVIKPGSVCSNFVQNTDMVPTFFDAAGADIPDGYRMDGKSIMPILSDPSAEVHDHLYFELGNGRAVRTKDWKYIAIRYSADQFEKIKRQPLLKIAQYLSYQGGAKNASRHMMSRPHYLEPDQLYNLANDPLEMKNLAKNPRFKAQLEKMRGLLTAKLKAQGRPFGEFVPGADSVQAEEIWPYLEKMKQLRPVKKGFEIIGDATNAPAGTPAKELNREERKKLREERKKKRLENNVVVPPAAKAEQPNFIFIMTDDQGYGDLGCYGHPTIKTPNIDAMAAHGVRFTDFYARHKCSPSRASLMSGAFNFRVGIGSIVHPHSSTGMCKETVTIPEMLKEKGYTSALIGKWHLGHTIGYLPMDQGFDSYFGCPNPNHGNAMNHGLPVAEGFKPGGGLTMEDYQADAQKGSGRATPLMRDDKVIEWPTDITQLTKRYTHKSVQFIKQNKNKPFFLYIAHGTPHHPYTVDASFRGKSTHGLYGDMIEEIDWSVGEVLKALKENGLEKKTIVAFTTDNGADSKPDRNGNKEKGSNLPLKGWKGSSDEGGVRVPFVVTWPGTLPEGKETGEMASLMDILPTFAALTGIEPKTPQKIDGKNIFPIMKCLPDVKSPNKYLYYAPNNPRITAVRNHRFKLFYGKRNELYDLRSDIGETKNVADEHPGVVKELKRAIELFQKDLEEHSLEAPFDEGQAAYLKTKNKDKSSKEKRDKKEKR